MGVLRKHLILAIVLLAVSSISRASDEHTTESKHSVANWILQTVKGDQITLYDELQKNNTVVMVFWATWCKYCQTLLPSLNNYAKTLGGSRIQLYALNIWEDGDPKQYLADHQITIDTILNAEAQARQFNVAATPDIIAIAPNKKIVYRRKAGETIENVIAAIERLK